MNDADAVRKPFSGIENLGRVNDGASGGSGFAGAAFQCIDAMGIHAGGKRLVQEPELGFTASKATSAAL